MRFAPFSIVRYQLYLFQLEGYEVFRYLKLLAQRGFVPSRSPLRKRLVWTQKAVAIFTLSALAVFAGAAWATAAAARAGQVPQWRAMAVFVLTVWLASFASFAFFILASLVLWPLEYLLRRSSYAQARRKLASLPNVKIVAVAGSFGRTTRCWHSGGERSFRASKWTRAP
jgi:hypothetical protein